MRSNLIERMRSNLIDMLKGFAILSMIVEHALIKIAPEYNPLVWIGEKSLFIYIFSLFFVGLYIGSGCLGVLTSCLFSLSVAVILTLIWNLISKRIQSRRLILVG